MAKAEAWKNRIVGHGEEAPDQLLANPANWRVHPKAQQDALAGVLDDVGWVQDVIVNRQTGHLVDGHLRVVLAMRRNEPTIPVVYVDLNEREETLILASLDPIGAMAAADKEKLDALLRDVETGEAGVQAMLAELAAKSGLDYGNAEESDAEPQIDRAEELRQKWQTEAGQLWRIGEHRLLVGDSTKREDVERVMAGEKAAICFTSPPYNAGVSAQLSGNTSIDDNLYKNEYDDNQSQPEYLKLLDGFTAQSLAVCEYVFVNIQVLAGNKRAFLEYWHKYADKFADVAIWDKGHAAPQQAQRVMDSRFEFVIVFSHQGNRAIGTRDFRGMVHNVYDGNPQRHNEFSDMHAATFPLDFPEHFVKTFTNQDDLVYEPFAGSGTTIVACQNLGRRCRAIEISPAYCAVILERMSAAFPGIEIESL